MAVARQVMASQLVGWMVLAVVCVYLLWPLRDTLRLGMDLAGGTYLTLQVQADKAIEADLIDLAQTIEGKLKKAQRPVPTTKQVSDNTLILSFDSMQLAQETAIFLKDDMPAL